MSDDIIEFISDDVIFMSDDVTDLISDNVTYIILDDVSDIISDDVTYIYIYLIHTSINDLHFTQNYQKQHQDSARGPHLETIFHFHCEM